MSTTINAKKDAKTTKMAAKAANLQDFVQRVWAETNLECKKIVACLMAEQFEVGGKEAFIKAINDAPDKTAVDRIATNAMLKGEGMSTKRF